jgi:hypothetical protein
MSTEQDTSTHHTSRALRATRATAICAAAAVLPFILQALGLAS